MFIIFGIFREFSFQKNTGYMLGSLYMLGSNLRFSRIKDTLQFTFKVRLCHLNLNHGSQLSSLSTSMHIALPCYSILLCNIHIDFIFMEKFQMQEFVNLNLQ